MVSVKISPPPGHMAGWILAITVSSLFYAAAGALLWVSWMITSAGEEVATWVEVPAHVVRVEVVDVKAGREESWSLECEYSYSWDGTDYTSDQVSRTGMPGSREELQAIRDGIAARADRGEPVPAFIDLDDPSRAVLVREVQTGIVSTCLILASMFIILTTLWLGSGLKKEIAFRRARRAARRECME